MKTLVITNIQNNFLPSGVLEITESEQVICLINELMTSYDHVVATQGFHSDGHVDLEPSITSINFPAKLKTGSIDHIIQKNISAHTDSSSDFHNQRLSQQWGTKCHSPHRTPEKGGGSEVHIAGFTTSYCVKLTALATIKDGFKTTLIVDVGNVLTAGEALIAVQLMFFLSSKTSKKCFYRLTTR